MFNVIENNIILEQQRSNVSTGMSEMSYTIYHSCTGIGDDSTGKDWEIRLRKRSKATNILI